MNDGWTRVKCGVENTDVSGYGSNDVGSYDMLRCITDGCVYASGVIIQVGLVGAAIRGSLATIRACTGAGSACHCSYFLLVLVVCTVVCLHPQSGTCSKIIT